MKKIIVLIFLVFVFANANNNIIQLRLIDSVSINKSKVARANFVSLGSNASAEFRRAIFQGNINYEKLSNGETRTTIVWSTVRDGQKSANVPPFLTKVSSRATSIAGGTVVKAVGNTEELTNAIRNMDNDSSFSDTVKDLTSGNEENLSDGGFGNNLLIALNQMTLALVETHLVDGVVEALEVVHLVVEAVALEVVQVEEVIQLHL